MNAPLLDKLTFSFKCPVQWDAMNGDEVRRFCDKCQKSVNNLSEMTREEAEAFLAEAVFHPHTCVRLLRDLNGNAITKGCGKSEGIRPLRAGVAATASALALSACAKDKPAPMMGTPAFGSSTSGDHAIAHNEVTMGIYFCPPTTQPNSK